MEWALVRAGVGDCTIVLSAGRFDVLWSIAKGDAARFRATSGNACSEEDCTEWIEAEANVGRRLAASEALETFWIAGAVHRSWGAGCMERVEFDVDITG